MKTTHTTGLGGLATRLCPVACALACLVPCQIRAQSDDSNSFQSLKKELEPKPGIPPTPPHLARVIQTMKEENLKLIFVEPHLNWRTAETVARQTGATAVLVSQFPGGVKGTEGGYIQLLDHLVNTVAKGLGAS
jgi:hypothetical protein